MPDPVEFDPDAIKAIAHPMRQRIIALLHERDRSPKELSQALREPLPNVVYHVRVLEQVGAVEVSETIEHKGTIERRFRLLTHMWLTDSDVGAMPEVVRGVLTAPIVRAIHGDLAAAAAAGTIDARADSHVSRTWLDLDERGWQDVAAVLAAALERVVEIRAEARARLARGPGAPPPIRSEVVILHFELPSSRSDGQDPSTER